MPREPRLRLQQPDRLTLPQPGTDRRYQEAWPRPYGGLVEAKRLARLRALNLGEPPCFIKMLVTGLIVGIVARIVYPGPLPLGLA